MSRLIDNGSCVADTLHMYLHRAMSECFKSLAIVVFVLALVFYPPSAAHAASGMHDNQHKLVAHTEVQSDTHVHGMSHGAASSLDGASTTSESDDSSGNCCSGVCFSVVLDSTHRDFARSASTGGYIVLDAQTDSVEPSGFLRPPQS